MRPIYLQVLLLLPLLDACDQPAHSQPTATITSTPRPALTSTPPPSPTSGAVLVAAGTAVAVGILPIPTAPATLMPTIPATSTPLEIATAAVAVPVDKSGIGADVANFFTEFYQTQTLQKGGALSPNWVRNIAEEPYLDYAVSQMRQEAKEADAGRLLELTYGDITTRVETWQAAGNGSGTAIISVKRTRHVTREGSAPV